MLRPRLPAFGVLVALTAGWGCTSSSASAPPVDGRGCSDWPDRPGELLLSLDGASRFEVEPFLLTGSGDPVVAWEACGCDDVTRVGYARRGASGFERPRYLSSPGGQMASNVTFARDGDGTLYAAWASWTPGPDPAQPHLGVTDIRIQLARWRAGAADFDTPTEISEPIADQLYDKPWMIVTPDGTVLVSFSDLRRGGIWVAASADHGTTFRRTRVETAWANLAAACPDGSPGGAYLTWVAARIRVAHTSDGGLTWSAPSDVAVADYAGTPAMQDPTCVAAGDQVWIAYGRTNDGYDMPVERLLDVEVAHVAAGLTVDRTTVALVAQPSAEFLLFPQLTRARDGRLALATYRANRTGSAGADLVYSLSTDDGASFGPPVTLATGLTPSLERHVPDWLGDYFGWAPTAAGLGIAFVDNASGVSHIAFAER